MFLVRFLDLKFLHKRAAIKIGTSNPPHWWPGSGTSNPPHEGASTPGFGGVPVHRALGRRPGWPEIGKLRLQALDLEPEHSPAGEYECHHPGGCVGLGKLNGQQVEHRLLAGRIDLAALAAVHTLETQRRAAAPE